MQAARHRSHRSRALHGARIGPREAQRAAIVARILGRLPRIAAAARFQARIRHPERHDPARARLAVHAARGVAIRLESGPGQPILYSQERVGERGRVFRLYKFRSMRTDAEMGGAARWASENDPRVTRVGRVIRKLRLDELPQLWNVLAGSMSLIGPRPE